MKRQRHCVNSASVRNYLNPLRFFVFIIIHIVGEINLELERTPGKVAVSGIYGEEPGGELDTAARLDSLSGIPKTNSSGSPQQRNAHLFQLLDR